MTEPQFLDMRSYPTEQVVTGSVGMMHLGPFVAQLEATMRLWQGQGLVKSVKDDGTPVDSLGWAMTKPNRDFTTIDGSDPSDLIWMWGGWGSDVERYAANAARKLWPLVDCDADDTLELVDAGIMNSSYGDLIVPSQNDDGKLPWGVFPHPGAVRVKMGAAFFGFAVSTYTGRQDQVAAHAFGGHIIMPISENPTGWDTLNPST